MMCKSSTATFSTRIGSKVSSSWKRKTRCVKHGGYKNLIARNPSRNMHKLRKTLWVSKLTSGGIPPLTGIFYFGWRQLVAGRSLILAGAVEVNVLAQGPLRQFTQRPWIEHVTFQLRGGHSTTELSPPPGSAALCASHPSSNNRTRLSQCFETLPGWDRSVVKHNSHFAPTWTTWGRQIASLSVRFTLGRGRTTASFSSLETKGFFTGPVKFKHVRDEVGGTSYLTSAENQAATKFIQGPLQTGDAGRTAWHALYTGYC